MSSATLLTAALALAECMNASPVNRAKDAFSIQQVKLGVHLRNGPGQIALTLQKFGKDVPKNVQIAADNHVAASGSVPAEPNDNYDSVYVCPVVIGNTTFQLDFDTGSSDLWVYSSLLSQSQLNSHNYYEVDPSKQKHGHTWKIGYGDGSTASGKVYVDKVTVAGVTAASQAIEAAASVSSSILSRKGVDGFLGLAFSSVNQIQPAQQLTFFDTIKHSLRYPLFAVTLKHRAPGSYDFGFIDSTKYIGPLTFVNVNASRGFWGIQATGYYVGSDRGSVTRALIDGIVDTGTTLIYVDASVTESYYNSLPGAQLDQQAGGYVFPCSTTPPDFSIIIGGVAQTVPGKLIVYTPTYQGSGMCFGGIQSNVGLGFTILGDVFLKSSYVVFMAHGSTPSIGFAKQA